MDTSHPHLTSTVPWDTWHLQPKQHMISSVPCHRSFASCLWNDYNSSSEEKRKTKLSEHLFVRHRDRCWSWCCVWFRCCLELVHSKSLCTVSHSEWQVCRDGISVWLVWRLLSLLWLTCFFMCLCQWWTCVSRVTEDPRGRVEAMDPKERRWGWDRRTKSVSLEVGRKRRENV